MKKVPVDLISTLLAEEEVLREASACMQELFYGTVRPPYMNCIYKKEQGVPEGIYTAKILDIKCHTTSAYRMKLELLDYENKVIYGYCRRFGSDFSDLADCFGEEPVLHRNSTGYIGEVGKIRLTHSGWIEKMSRDMF